MFKLLLTACGSSIFACHPSLSLVSIKQVLGSTDQQCDGASVDATHRVVMVMNCTRLQFSAPPASQSPPLMSIIFVHEFKLLKVFQVILYAFTFLPQHLFSGLVRNVERKPLTQTTKGILAMVSQNQQQNTHGRFWENRNKLASD